MLDFRGIQAILDIGIDYPESVLEERREIAAIDVAILVNGRAQHRPTLFAIPLGIICATAKERDPVWSASDNHGAYGLSNRGFDPVQIIADGLPCTRRQGFRRRQAILGKELHANTFGAARKLAR